MTERRRGQTRIVPPIEAGIVIVPEKELVRAYFINTQIRDVLRENIAQRTDDRVREFDDFLTEFFAGKPAKRLHHPKSAYSATKDQLEDELHEENVQLADGTLRHIRYVTTFKNGNTIVARHLKITEPNSLYKNYIGINFLDNHIGMQYERVHVTLVSGEPHRDPLTAKQDPSTYPDVLDYFKDELSRLRSAATITNK